jgi:hypothetical protein
MFLSKRDGEVSQADLVAQNAIDMVRSIQADILQLTANRPKYDVESALVYHQIADAYRKSGFEEKYIKDKWNKLITSILDTQSELKKQQESNTDNSDNTIISTLQEKLKSQLEELDNWNNGKNFTDFTLDALLILNPNLSDNLFKLGKKSYARDVFNVDYEKLTDTGEVTKQQVDEAYKRYKEGFKKE